MSSNITIVVAMDRNRAIGRDNQLPWRIKADLELFKKNTLGKTVLMGRRTAESIGRALPFRTNLVLTSGAMAPFNGQTVVRSLTEALQEAVGELMVIGGAQLYKEALPFADRILLSRVDGRVEGADTFFPEFVPSDYEIDNLQKHRPAVGEEFGFTFMDLRRSRHDIEQSVAGTGTGVGAESVRGGAAGLLYRNVFGIPRATQGLVFG